MEYLIAMGTELLLIFKPVWLVFWGIFSALVGDKLHTLIHWIIKHIHMLK